MGRERLPQGTPGREQRVGGGDLSGKKHVSSWSLTPTQELGSGRVIDGPSNPTGTCLIEEWEFQQSSVQESLGFGVGEKLLFPGIYISVLRNPVQTPDFCFGSLIEQD